MRRSLFLASLLFIALLAGCQSNPPKKQAGSELAAQLIKAVEAGDRNEVESLLNQSSTGTLDNTGGFALLLIAVEKRHVNVAELLISRGADVNGRTPKQGITPLIRAGNVGDAAMIRLLHHKGADIHAFDDEIHATALSFAAYKGRDSAIPVLIELGSQINQRDKLGNTPLNLAAIKAGRSTVQLLLSHGANPNIGAYYGFTPLMNAAERGDIEMVEALIAAGANIHRRDVNKRAAINHASNAKNKTVNHSRIIALLKEHGADTNGDNRDIDKRLLEAATRGQLGEVKKLLVKGADIEARDSYGFTVLMKASGRPETSIYLLDQGADPFAMNRGKQGILQNAAGSGNLTLIKRLVDMGVPFDDHQNNREETPLNRAVQTGHYQVAKFLLEKGASPNKRSKFGTPLMLAIERNNKDMIALLKKHGAQ